MKKKWSIYRILMLILYALYLSGRIYSIQYQDLAHLALFTQLIILGIETTFFLIILTLPSGVRTFAIFPIILLVLFNIYEFVQFLGTTNPTEFYLFLNLSTRAITVFMFLTYAILLLPTYKYRFRHAVIAASFVLPFFIVYLLNIIDKSKSLAYYPISLILLIFGTVILGGIYLFSIPVFFTLYIIDESNQKVVPIEK